MTRTAAYSNRGRLELYLPETESENNGAPVKQLYHDEGQDDIEDVNHGLLPYVIQQALVLVGGLHSVN